MHALSGDLPTGQLSMPGSGFLPKIVATLTIIFGLMLIVRAAKAGRSPKCRGTTASTPCWSRSSPPSRSRSMSVSVSYHHAAADHALLLVVERRNPLRAGVYSAAVVLFTYVCFAWMLKTPLPEYSF